MTDARKCWLDDVVPAMSRLRMAAKDDASGITPREIQEVADALAHLNDCLVDFEGMIDAIE